MDLQELIDDYLAGKMSPEDRRLFENLIADNPKYQSELKQQTKGREALKLAEKHRSQTNLKSWSISAGIACAVVLAGYLLWITLGMSPGEKLYAKYYKPIPRQFLPTMVDADETKLTADAFQAYEAKDFEKAEELFDQIPFSPDTDYLLLYQGICQLELGRPEKAIPLFKMIKSETLKGSRETASWFTALAYFKLNMMEKGESALRLTAAMPNSYQEQAKTILEQLD